MRSSSVDGWDSITHPERGPLGSGDGVEAVGVAHSGDSSSWYKASSEDGTNVGIVQGNGWVGLNPAVPAEGSDPNWEVPDA